MMHAAEKEVVASRMVMLEVRGTWRALKITQRNNTAKTHMETSCMMIPAIISCVPVAVLFGGTAELVEEAVAPPMAWMTIDRRSKLAKMIR